MHHVAIMKKSWRLIDKILAHEKTIESRWYKSKYSPWNKIKIGDVIYFKNSGEKISAKAKVENILQFKNLDEKKIRTLLKGYEKNICTDKIPNFFDLVKNKKYCILIFLKDAKKIKPFDIDKSGFGLMSAWICAQDINKIKIKK